jgi:hypothetical protein
MHVQKGYKPAIQIFFWRAPSTPKSELYVTHDGAGPEGAGASLKISSIVFVSTNLLASASILYKHLDPG